MGNFLKFVVFLFGIFIISSSSSSSAANHHKKYSTELNKKEASATNLPSPFPPPSPSLRGSDQFFHHNSHLQHHDPQHKKISASIDEETFFMITNTTKSDKIVDHQYSDMYGEFLLPYIRKKRLSPQPAIKFFEIGMGCIKESGAGESMKIWKSLLSHQNDSIWGSDLDKRCIERLKTNEFMKGMHFLSGDQSNFTTLDSWIETSEALKVGFDIVVDDGGHQHHMIYNSFVKLWPTIVPGGIYFIEDLLIARDRRFNDKTGKGINMFDLIHSWIEQLVVPTQNPYNYTSLEFSPDKQIPKDIRMISCVSHACVIMKCWKISTLPNLSHCS